MSDLLRVDNLFKVFRTRSKKRGDVRAVDGVSFVVNRGETLGLVGESGCGKSTVARLVLRLLEATDGRILFDGTDISRLGPKELLPVRRRMQVVFQDPFASLNSRFTIRSSLKEPFQTHGIKFKGDKEAKLCELLGFVGLDSSVLDRKTSELSGGQLQRVAIARALALEPEFIVADEPTSSLDVSIQAQIVNLLLQAQQDRAVSYLLISHDIDLVAHMADRIAVMYLGVIVELAGTTELLVRPLHPYTQALLSAVPVPDPEHERNRHRIILGGDPPNAAAIPPGCRFHPRCPVARPECATEVPALRFLTTAGDVEHLVSCHLAPQETEEMGLAIASARAGGVAPPPPWEAEASEAPDASCAVEHEEILGKESS